MSMNTRGGDSWNSVSPDPPLQGGHHSSLLAMAEMRLWLTFDKGRVERDIEVEKV